MTSYNLSTIPVVPQSAEETVLGLFREWRLQNWGWNAMRRVAREAERVAEVLTRRGIPFRGVNRLAHFQCNSSVCARYRCGQGRHANTTAVHHMSRLLAVEGELFLDWRGIHDLDQLGPLQPGDRRGIFAASGPSMVVFGGGDFESWRRRRIHLHFAETLDIERDWRNAHLDFHSTA